jgi:hypothetical protein
MYDRALARYKKQRGIDHTSTLRVVNNLSVIIYPSIRLFLNVSAIGYPDLISPDLISYYAFGGGSLGVYY